MTKPANNELHSTRLVVPLTPAMREQIDDMAYGQRITRAELVRRAVQAYVPDEEAK